MLGFNLFIWAKSKKVKLKETNSNSSIRVMHFVFRLECGGLETVVSSLINSFSGTEIIPILCCLKNEGTLARNLKKNGVPVYAFDHFKGVAWSLSFKLKKIPSVS